MFEKLGTPLFLKEVRGNEENARPFSLFKTLLIFLLVYGIANFLQGVFLTPVVLVVLFSSEGVWELFSDATALEDGRLEALTERMLRSDAVLVATLVATAAVIVCAVFYCRLVEKRSFLSMGIRKKDALPSALAGAGTALLLLLLALLFGTVFGAVSLDGLGKVRPGLLLLLFLGFLVQGFAEEVLFRGYLMTSLSRGTSLFSAMVISSLLFSFFHRANAGVTPLAFLNLFLFGILASLYMIRGGNLFGAAALHALWNIGEGLILGSPVSGELLPTSLLSLSLAEDAALLHGGAFGLEGGIAVTFALTLGIAVLAMMKTREN